MRKDVGDAAVKAGTNIITAGAIGLFFLNDDVGFVNSMFAIAGGFAIVIIGVWLRDGGTR